MQERDPWTVTIATLQGEHLVPVVAWPESRRRVIAARGWLEDLPELPPEPKSTVMDEAVLRALEGIGRASVRGLAEHARVSKSAAARSLQRLQASGLVRREVDGYAAA